MVRQKCSGIRRSYLEATLVQEALTLKGLETPLRKTDVLRKDKRSELIAGYMTKVMELLQLDLTDDSLRGTPGRIADMFINEVFSGLDYANFPKITLMENKM
ncbi:hypothetical protein ABW06_26115, partial [Pluralibacter gergoviae]